MNHYFATMECGLHGYFAERVQFGQLAKALKNGLACVKFLFVCCPLMAIFSQCPEYAEHSIFRANALKFQA